MINTAHPETAFALDAARAAARVARKVQREMQVEGVQKADASPVTVGDFALQAIVAQKLAQAFPEDLLIAEENAGILREEANAELLQMITHFVRSEIPTATPESVCDWIDLGTAKSGQRFWTLDPIDGTKGYLRGGNYAAALALVVDGVVQLGVLACPKLPLDCSPRDDGEGMLAIARRGEGAWRGRLEDGADAFEQMHASPCADPSQVRLLRSYESAHTNTSQVDGLAAALGTSADPVRMDSQAKYAVLAAGFGEVLVRFLSPDKPDYKEKIWDQAAGTIVLEEAGGRITDLYGNALDFSHGRKLERNRGVLATNGKLHDQVLEAMKEVL
ncbi:MAG: 3'(2'),5'-bisphosphate nucleotidase [Candidatus Hydrogenedentes bacterium]|nr:3'(2'),5'-bisphosphate nucleotidase [Candidatus Hydrogenedentota bacterium]